MTKQYDGNEHVQICRDCNDRKNRMYQIKGSDMWICQECLMLSSQYDECVICKKSGARIAYDDSELHEGNDGQRYCKEHLGCDKTNLTASEKDIIDKFNKNDNPKI